MFTLPLDSVSEWIQWNDHWVPRSVDYNCPHCRRTVNFDFNFNRHNAVTFSLPMHAFGIVARCPGCGKDAQFWAVDVVKYGSVGGRACGDISMHPSPALGRAPMKGLDKVPADVSRAYLSAFRIFNTGECDATAVLVGRALEALVKSKLPDDKHNKPLVVMLDELQKTFDLAKTLTTLTDGLRKGRNIGAHFDSGKETSPEMAKMMLEFLEYFIEYLYILPGEVADLHSKL